MRRHLLIFSLLIGCWLFADAQEEFDVTKHIADTRAFTFDDGKNTVIGYISVQLEEKTSCCGKDRIYLEVKIDPSGNVLHAKAITGTNDCIKRSAADIVKSIKWDAAELRGPTSKYLEIRPEIDCKDGSRDNVYKQVAVFNNDLLDEQGNPKDGGSSYTPPVASQQASSQPKTSTPTPKETTPAPTETKTTPKEEVATNTQPAETNSTPAEPMKEESEPVQESPSSDNGGDVNADDAVAENQTDATKAAQEEEVIKLREQLAELREKEIKKRRIEAQKARRRKAAQQRRDQAMAAKQAKEEGGFGQSGDLFADDPYANDNGGDGFGGASEGASQDAMLDDDIAKLTAQIDEMLAANEEREAQAKAAIEETQSTKGEILRMREQIAQKEEEKERYREEQELAQIEKEKLEAEEARRAEEEEYQRMMDEIKRLQDEANARIAELEAKKQEVERVAKLKTMREQEIALERALRDKERQKKMMDYQLGLKTGADVNFIADGSEGTDLANLQLNPEDFTTAADSEKLAQLIQTIQVMQTEIIRLREQIGLMEGNASYVGTNPVASSNTSGNTRSATDPKKKTTSKGGDGKLKNGGTDKSYTKLDYRDPNADQSIYPEVKKTSPASSGNNGTTNNSGNYASNDNNGGNMPESQKTGNHENSTGPVFQEREYVGGKAAMKDLIKTELKLSGICGLAQALFSVTLDPSGNVKSSKILAANKPEVEVQLLPIINDLKFNSVDIRIPQTIYLEFKAEVLCEGSEKINLKEVKDIIND
ncbi:MAG: hypothetical protein AAFY71_08290 [Bacteroidota bacterium]